MLIDKGPNGSLIICQGWRHFLEDWRTATPAERTVLPDRRPAVRREGEDGRATYLTIYPAVWEFMRGRITEAFRQTPPPKRVRLCAGCREEMVVTIEYEDVWCWTCPQCRSSETWGKNLVGGTIGAGLKEKR